MKSTSSYQVEPSGKAILIMRVGEENATAKKLMMTVSVYFEPLPGRAQRVLSIMKYQTKKYGDEKRLEAYGDHESSLNEAISRSFEHLIWLRSGKARRGPAWERGIRADQCQGLQGLKDQLLESMDEVHARLQKGHRS